MWCPPVVSLSWKPQGVSCLRSCVERTFLSSFSALVKYLEASMSACLDRRTMHFNPSSKYLTNLNRQSMAFARLTVRPWTAIFQWLDFYSTLNSGFWFGLDIKSTKLDSTLVLESSIEVEVEITGSPCVRILKSSSWIPNSVHCKVQDFEYFTNTCIQDQIFQIWG